MFAVAFACVVSFMGIGLVDPLLPAISHEMHASPSEVTLLFTSYLVVTAVAVLITNRVSSRLGAKRTLIGGLILIVIFSALAPVRYSVLLAASFRDSARDPARIADPLHLTLTSSSVTIHVLTAACRRIRGVLCL